MAGWLELDTIAPGTPVFDAEERPLGTVEAVEEQSLRVGGRAIPGVAIARVDPSGIFLHPEGSWARLDDGSGGAAPIAGDSSRGDRPMAIIDEIAGNRATTDVAADDRAAAPPARVIDRAEGQIVIPLAEERPTVTHRAIDLGEIIVVKRVVEEERLIPVRVRREIVERVTRAADGSETIVEISSRTIDPVDGAANSGKELR